MLIKFEIDEATLTLEESQVIGQLLGIAQSLKCVKINVLLTGDTASLASMITYASKFYPVPSGDENTIPINGDS
jgi:hypothetical protein